MSLESEMQVLKFLNKVGKPQSFAEIVAKTKLSDGDVRASLGRGMELGRIKCVNLLAHHGLLKGAAGYRYIEPGYTTCQSAPNADS